MLACLRAGSTSRAPSAEGAPHPEKLLKLREECAKQENQDKAVCKQLAATPRACPSGHAVDPACRLPVLRRCRRHPAAAPAAGTGPPRSTSASTGRRCAADELYDPALVSLLVPGMVVRDDHPPHQIQLIVFVLITLLGVSYVGARYARLDRLFSTTRYTVVAHFADSGGIFAGGEVTYRGVAGRPGREAGAHRRRRRRLPRHRQRLRHIPADTLAVVGNRSAVGEQYVELQPQVDGEPYLRTARDRDDGHPHPDPDPEAAGRHLDHRGVGRPGRRCSTTVGELGEAFGGTGQDLQRIIDSGNSFITPPTPTSTRPPR